MDKTIHLCFNEHMAMHCKTSSSVKLQFILLLFLQLGLGMERPVFASHFMGGEMTARHLSGYDYELHLTVYRDTVGVHMDSFANIVVYDGPLVVAGSYCTFTDSSGYLLPLFPYGVEVYHFIDTIAFPGPGQYALKWKSCCRNDAINNVAPGPSYSIFLKTDLTVSDTALAMPNSSPAFVQEPVVFMPINEAWSYNPMAYDVDGDSMVWSIDTPLTSYIDDYHFQIAGYYDPPGYTVNPFTIDPNTGSITWTPKMEGNWVVSIRVEEFRGGQSIGSIVRDMQMIVVNEGYNGARFCKLDGLVPHPAGGFRADLPMGEAYALRLLVDDPDNGNLPNLNAFGEVFDLEESPAQFETYPVFFGKALEGVLEWSPLPFHQRSNPYITVFRLDDGVYANDLTIRLRVVEPTVSIPALTGDLDAQVFPNPGFGRSVLRLDLRSAQTVAIRLLTRDGRLEADYGVQDMGRGVNDFVLPVLEAGMYYIEVKGQDGRHVLPFVSLQ